MIRGDCWHDWKLSGSYSSSAFEHFVGFGLYENRTRQALLFDEVDYSARYPDVAAGIEQGDFASGLEHFILFGTGEGRDPGQRFDESAYLAANPDVAAAVNSGSLISGFLHYLVFGAAENRPTI
ncbi:MAG: hypothetical protein AAF722_18520 [Cyanobacteria bacterium P01_C01_bin.70]